MAMETTAQRPSGSFEHEALFYSGEREFAARTSAFIREAVGRWEPVLVVVSAAKIDLLRAELAGDAGDVRFEDMADLGRNPASMIPAWADFVAEQERSGRGFRGIGEPVTAERGPEELVECERDEALLNLAFAEGPPWWLLCPYDTRALPPTVLDVAAENHPSIVESGTRRPSPKFPGIEVFSRPFADPLPPPPEHVAARPFTDVRAVRRFVADTAPALGAPDRVDDLVLATSEIATNSLLYGGGGGTVAMWAENHSVVCEIRDTGRIVDPMLGRRRPDLARPSGFGLWLANQVCDLVQLRSDESGSVIRLRVEASTRDPRRARNRPT
jgi:anti-sigma regulatory factor (Ser/Thr protein kinase)